jgi:hypothetical protein
MPVDKPLIVSIAVSPSIRTRTIPGLSTDIALTQISCHALLLPLIANDEKLTLYFYTHVLFTLCMLRHIKPVFSLLLAL